MALLWISGRPRSINWWSGYSAIWLPYNATGLFSYVIVNGIVQSSTEKPRNHQSKDSNPPSKARSFDSSRNNRPNNHDNRDSGYKKINNNNNGQESRVEDRKGTGDKTSNRFTAEERPSLTHSKEREGRSVNSEAVNNDRSRQGFNPTDENRNNSRTEQRSERSEKPPSRTQVSLQNYQTHCSAANNITVSIRLNAAAFIEVYSMAALILKSYFVSH